MSFPHIIYEASYIAGAICISECTVAVFLSLLPLSIILAPFANEESASPVHFVISPLTHISVSIRKHHCSLAFAQVSLHLALIDAPIFVHLLSLCVRSNGSSPLYAWLDSVSALTRL